MNKRYKVSCDLFTIPLTDNTSMLYAPRTGFLCRANRDVVNLLSSLGKKDSLNYNEKQIQVLELLEENGVLNGSPEVAVKSVLPQEFAPTRVTLFPTNRCNLRCIYCYASAGDSKPLTMNRIYAVTAINTIITNALRAGDNFISIGFHGGGEPLYPWTFIQKVTEYAEHKSLENNLNLAVYAGTNGLLGEKQLDWITRHFSDLNISFDGLPGVQDYHRPLPGGQGSFKYVDRTFRTLDEKGFNYGIRSTFSEYNIDRMEESYDFIMQNYHPKTIHFEPVFQCGRCKTNDRFRVNFEKFAASFKTIDLKNKDTNVRFTYSGCRVETLTDSFCGVTRDGFSVTPDGHITACFETTSAEDPKSEFFFYGRIDDTGHLTIDENKREFLHHLTVDNLKYCSDCFAKWHCAGDCAAKLGHSELNGDRGHERCLLNRQMVKDKLISLLGEHQQTFLQ